MRLSSALLLASCAFLFAGCSAAPGFISTSPVSSFASGTALHGRVHGGQNPISGANVYLYAVSAGGYGNASTSLLKSPGYVTTDSNGNFSITGEINTCPAGAQVYIYALGGNPGLASGTNNTAAGLLAGLGSCSALAASQFIFVNEVSTVATAYALAGYATDATDISSSNSTLATTGVANAFKTITNLETLSTGTALATTPAANGGNGTVPQAEINTLANILAACINTTSASSTPCTKLFSNAMNGSKSPTDAATAAINIAHNPGANIANLFALQGSSPPFIPDVATQPNDFTLVISYTGTAGCTLDGVEGIAADAQGDIWVANDSVNSICEFSPLGGPAQAVAITGNGLSAPQNIAIDGSGYIWVTSVNSSALSSFTSTGAAVTSTTSGGLDGPSAIAIDGSNNVWVTNVGVGIAGLTEFSTSSGAPSAITGDPFGTSVLGQPVAVAVDINGNAWVGDYGTINEFSASSPSTISTYTGGGMSNDDDPTAIAFDPSGNIWVAYTISSSTPSISEFNSSGGAISGSSGYTGGGLGEPVAVAVDSNGNVWVGNEGGTISEFSPSGAALSPDTGYGYGSSQAVSSYLVIDGSGNIWGTGIGQTFSEWVGLAAPVVTPMAANLQAPYASNKSAVNRP